MTDFAALTGLIQSELKTGEELLSALEQEKALLEARQLDGLGDLLSHKANLLTALEQVRNKRNALLLPMGLSEDQTILSQQLAEAQEPLATAALDALKTLSEQLVKCKYYNELIGILISKSRKRNQRRMDIMKGVANEQKLYTAHGQTTTASARSNVHEA